MCYYHKNKCTIFILSKCALSPHFCIIPGKMSNSSSIMAEGIEWTKHVIMYMKVKYKFERFFMDCLNLCALMCDMT